MAHDGPGLMAPADFPIRDPRSRPKDVGRIVNATGWPMADSTQGLGGLDSASKMPKHGNAQTVEKPTSITTGSSSAMGGGGLRGRKGK